MTASAGSKDGRLIAILEDRESYFVPHGGKSATDLGCEAMTKCSRSNARADGDGSLAATLQPRSEGRRISLGTSEMAVRHRKEHLAASD